MATHSVSAGTTSTPREGQSSAGGPPRRNTGGPCRAWRACVSGLIGLALVTGCTVGPEYRRPQVPVPAAWRTATEGAGSLADLAWWDLFQDPTLQGLIRAALTENQDLQTAVARVAEARATLGVTQAAQFPQVAASASYSNQRFSSNSFPPLPPGLDLTQNFYQPQVNLLSFELDLWGKLRRATEAARADLLAGEENRQTVVMTLVGDVAQAYFDLLALDREADIDRETLASRQASLELVRHRFEEGLTSELDVRRAEGEVAASAASVPDVERRIAQTEDRLSLLLGRNPGPIPRGAPLDRQPLPPEIPAGLPSVLLERRPDVRAAEERLVAANARIGEAKAAFFPQIILTGFFGVESGELGNLFAGPSRIWQAGPAITLPLLTEGRLRSNLEATEAREAEARSQYRQTIQAAFREVEDALVFHTKVREIRLRREQGVQAERQALTLAELRYTNGVSSYLEVLDAQRQLYVAETEFSAALRGQAVSVVQVYKALGGGWQMPSPDGKDRQP